MLTVGTCLFCDWIGMFDECRWWRRRKKRRWRISHNRIVSLQQLRTFTDFVVAAIVTTAVELVISWNNIGGVNDLDTAAQLIPPIISAAYVLRSIYVWMFEPPSEDDSSVEYSYWDGVSASYTLPRDSAGRAQIPSRTVYDEDPSYDWAGRTRHPHRRRHHRRSTYAGYGAGRQPEMSAAYPPAQGHAAGNIVEPEPIHENA
ncbi:hypothetical protein N0V93_000792 [Gnomoniopsis smithogilvyi]|uniref:Uncharacterized protein n=1 Tax=Gnomoniopsis smithogilvyi TaxID=1191159 RepID=A0A9W9D0K3_9PEZI|nr:hypothetical protein N0V93_000792 [Gnomoniopsis smithogilvyi]